MARGKKMTKEMRRARPARDNAIDTKRSNRSDNGGTKAREAVRNRLEAQAWFCGLSASDQEDAITSHLDFREDHRQGVGVRIKDAMDDDIERWDEITALCDKAEDGSISNPKCVRQIRLIANGVDSEVLV